MEKGDIGGKNNIQNWGMNNDDWIKLCDVNFVKTYNNTEPLQYFKRLAYFRRQGSNATNLWIHPQLICINFIQQSSGK